jgi:hypothetical protein
MRTLADLGDLRGLSFFTWEGLRVGEPVNLRKNGCDCSGYWVEPTVSRDRDWKGPPIVHVEVGKIDREVQPHAYLDPSWVQIPDADPVEWEPVLASLAYGYAGA